MMPTNFSQFIDILVEEAPRLWLVPDLKSTRVQEAVPPARELVVTSIGFGGRHLRGALTLAAPDAFLIAIAPEELRARRLERVLMVDFAGELCNLLMARLRNALLRRGTEVSCGTPTATTGISVDDLSSTAQHSEWQVFENATGKLFVRLDASFEEGYLLAAPITNAQVEPVVEDVFF